MAEIKRVTGRCMNREDELSLHRRADFKGHKPSNRTAAWHISILFEPTWTCGHDSGLFLTSYFNSKIAFIKVRKCLFLFKILEKFFSRKYLHQGPPQFGRRNSAVTWSTHRRSIQGPYGFFPSFLGTGSYYTALGLLELAI